MRCPVLELAVIGFGTCLAIVSSDMPAAFPRVLHRPWPIVNCCCLIFLISFQVVSFIVLGLLISHLLVN